MNSFEFSRSGGWRRLDRIGIEAAWSGSPENDWKTYRDSLGYDVFDVYGNEHGTNIAIFQPAEGKPWSWLVEVNTFNSWRTIECPEFPDVIELLQKLLPLVTSGFVTELVELSQLGVEVLESTEVVSSRRRRENYDRKRRLEKQQSKEAPKT